jgi:hypothetical protein
MENAVQNNFGEQVYVAAAYPAGLTLQQYYALTYRQRRKHTWRPMVRGWPKSFGCEVTSKHPKARAGD